MAGALSGLLVIAVEQAVAAPLCTMRLADVGARVIKVERDEGDFARGYDSVVHGESSYFAWLNRGKQSVAMDIKAEGDARLLDRMLAKADVLVQNLAPGAMARAGFGSAALREKYPRLITCDISGYGEDGPYRDMKAYDLLIQCEAGLASVTGSPDAPGRVGVSIADIGCGMNAHAAILEALFNRERTGRGMGIAVSLFSTLADWMAVPLLHNDYGGKAPSRVGLMHPSIAPYGRFELPGGASIVIAVQNEREWVGLCKALGVERLASDPRYADNVSRCANRAQLDGEVEQAMANHKVEALAELLRSNGIAYGFVNGVPELSRHPQLRRISVGSPSGPVDLPAPPVDRSGGLDPLGPVPAINSHGPAIRTEFA